MNLNNTLVSQFPDYGIPALSDKLVLYGNRKQMEGAYKCIQAVLQTHDLSEHMIFQLC